MEAIDKFYESDFSKKLLKDSISIVNKWSSIHAEKFTKTKRGESKSYEGFESVGTEDEQEQYRKIKKFWAMHEVLNDLGKVFIFLEVDRSKIIKIYPEIETQENYYKYHIENFIIRVATLVDLLGKLGNLLYETGIEDKRCNGYNFKEELKKTHPEQALLIEDILTHTKLNKGKRHQKLHAGELEIEDLKKIPIWEDYSSVLKTDFDDPILKAMTDDGIEEMNNSLKDFLILFIEKINLFLDKSIEQI